MHFRLLHRSQLILKKKIERIQRVKLLAKLKAVTICSIVDRTLFQSISFQYSISITPEKCEKKIGFLTFSGGIEIKYWAKMGEKLVNQTANPPKKSPWIGFQQWQHYPTFMPLVILYTLWKYKKTSGFRCF